MPYPNEHAARIASPDGFVKFRRENGKFGKSIDVIWGIKANGDTSIQAIRFAKGSFTVEQAKAWLRKHKYSPILFEPASGKSQSNNAFTRMLVNLKAEKAKVRHDSMEGRDYLVVPCVMMIEGVHEGSMGALYYPSMELSKTPEVWNAKPVVVYHPQINGVAKSACDPVIFDKQKIGVLMNTQWADNKLKTECWIDEAKVKEVDDRVLNAIQEGEVMEVSTGLFTDNENVEGEWNGKTYSAIARNYRPDHLAILPDLVGACSVSAGAGLLRNVAKKADGKPQFLKNFKTKGGFEMNREVIINGLIANEKSPWTEEDREALMVMSEEKLAWIVDMQKMQDEPKLKVKAPVVAPAPVPVANAVPAENKQEPTPPAKKDVSVDEYIQNAPVGIRDVLLTSVATHQEEKEKLVVRITANKRNTFSKEELQSKSLKELKSLVLLAEEPRPSNPLPNFAGMGEVVGNEDKAEEPLTAPVLNFEPEKKAVV